MRLGTDFTVRSGMVRQDDARYGLAFKVRLGEVGYGEVPLGGAR